MVRPAPAPPPWPSSVHPEPDDVSLRPGDWFVGRAPAIVRTVLGSCVSVTLWSPRALAGAMSHSLLATRGRARLAGEALDGRYGDEALRLMVAGLARLGVHPRECEAKIFGGGRMFGHRDAGADVGQRNGEAAREQLLGLGIEVVSEGLFGQGHRQIAFDVADGSVWARQVRPRPPAAPLPLFTAARTE